MTKPEKNALEWTVFAIGLVLVLATLGYLSRESALDDGGPPDVVARLGGARLSKNGYLVPVEVANEGEGTAEDVVVPIALELPDGTREEAELSIAFLPRDSKRNGWVSFRTDPRRGTLSLGAIAFEVP
ncbi:MAG: hypothetical protein H0T50_02760 [Gemmatimonadales bacterium]|nr:hypothetical protein [Gemmatimonadales bacterium]